MGRKGWTACLLGLVLVAGLAARGLLVSSGLPYVTHWDEPDIANTALEMMKTGDLNPRFFNYGSLLIYLNLGVDVAHYFYLVGRSESTGQSLATLDELEVGSDRHFPWYVSHPSFYAWNRFLTALFGTGCVLLCFLLATQVGDERAGLLAALFLAMLPFHVENSSYVEPDVPASFFAILTVWLSAGYLRHQKPVWLAMAAGSAGLAASVKYNMATCLLVPLGALVVAFLLRLPGYRRWLWPAVLVLPLLTFLAGTPYALFDLRTFLDHAGFEVRHYLIAGHEGFGVEPGLPHLWLDLQEMLGNAGVVPFSLAIVGVVISSRTRVGFLVFALPLLQIWLTSRTTVAFDRNLLLVYPFLAAAFGLGGVWLLDRIERLVAARRPAWHRIVLSGTWSLLILAVGDTTLPALAQSLRDGRRMETRSLAMTRIHQLFQEFPGRWNEVRIATELRLHPLDEERIRVPSSTAQTIDLLCRPQARALLVVGSEYRGQASEAGQEAQRINDLLAEDDVIVARIGGAPLWLDRYSRRPGVDLRESPSTVDSRSAVCADARAGRTVKRLEEREKRHPPFNERARRGRRGVPAVVILIGVDTLRADHLGLHGHGRPTSPRLDTSARDGMVFDWAFSTSPWTLPSFASIFTGRTPSGHGVTVNVWDEMEVNGKQEDVRPEASGEQELEIRGHFAKLPPSVPTLAGILADNGFATIGVVQNPILSPAFRLHRGFDVYDHEAGDNVESRRADEVVERALRWLDRYRRSERRPFLFVHFFDPHLNYDAPEPFRGMFTHGIPSALELPIRGAEAIRARVDSLSSADRDFIEAAYDEEVRFLDEELGRFFDALEERGIWDEALVILTSDHGEEFFEHGGFEHGHDVFNEQVRVPLVVWGPGVASGREPTPVSVTDIAPTILEAVGVEPPDEMSGVSLWPFLAAGEQMPRQPVIVEATRYGPERKAIIHWPYKLAVVPEEGRETLFDLVADPPETRDLSGPRSAIAATLRAVLGQVVNGGALSDDERSKLTSDVIDQLRSLGYVR